MVMGRLVEGTQLSKLIAGLLETNGRALPPGTGCGLLHASLAARPWKELVRGKRNHGTHARWDCSLRWFGVGGEAD